MFGHLFSLLYRRTHFDRAKRQPISSAIGVKLSCLLSSWRITVFLSATVRHRRAHPQPEEFLSHPPVSLASLRPCSFAALRLPGSRRDHYKDARGRSEKGKGRLVQAA